jgi:hypothetical protein
MTDTMTAAFPEGTGTPMPPPPEPPASRTVADAPEPAPPADPTQTPPPTDAPTEESDQPTDGQPADDQPAEETGDTGTPTFPGQRLVHTGKVGEIEKIADDYVIPLSDQAMNEWAKSSDSKAFKAYAEQVACGMYPTFAPQIQAGLVTRVLLDPYIQVAQQVLGPVMTEPNWSDPKWSAALQGGMDPKTGRPVPMQLDEWRKFLMQHPGHNWDKSPQAMQRAQQFAQVLNQGFTTPQEGEQ